MKPQEENKTRDAIFLVLHAISLAEGHLMEGVRSKDEVMPSLNAAIRELKVHDAKAFVQELTAILERMADGICPDNRKGE